MLTNTELTLWVNACKVELELFDYIHALDEATSESIVKRFWLRTELEISSKDFDEIVKTFHEWRIKQ